MPEFADYKEFQQVQKSVNRMVGAIILLAALLGLGWLTGFVSIPRGDQGRSGDNGTDGITTPIGGVVAWTAENPPTDNRWHICDGSELPTSEYRQLGNLLGTTHGNAENVDHVKLPDYRGYFLRGFDDRPTGEPGGDPDRPRNLGVLQEHAVQEHQHRIQGYVNHARIGRAGNQFGGLTNVQDQSRGYDTLPLVGGGLETRPADFAVHWIIRVK